MHVSMLFTTLYVYKKCMMMERTMRTQRTLPLDAKTNGKRLGTSRTSTRSRGPASDKTFGESDVNEASKLQ